ncbi:MAG: ERCC4 domain-containing protein [Pseudomonadota bacterium]
MLEPFTIVVDTREQTPFTFGDTPTVVKGLKTGDYSILGLESCVCIERKSLGDFVKCTTNNKKLKTFDRDRFERELVRMQEFPFRRVVIEATIQDVLDHAYRSGVHPSSVVGSAISWDARYNIPFVWAGQYGAAYTLRLLEKLHKHVTKAKETGTDVKESQEARMPRP